ncbi:SDR family oxidoreductase [Actinoplanes sp. NPDC049548]|uniref:SDR family NAD(P)-dependent oxidoreductase n=1 Tax=Actinoplanes sp. NPDC049548 TaxID=3155152 RepID=UPI003446D51E
MALVTGSTRGIGWRTAELLAAHGATVVVNGSRDEGAVETRVKELTACYGTAAFGVVCDAAQPEQVRAAYQRVFKAYGRLDVLVNNAGVLQDALVGMVSDELVEHSFRVNTFGAVHHLQAAARLMRRRGEGSIINLSSIIGTHGNAGQIVYSSTKAALLGLTRSAAKELAPHGIRVNAVAPGFIDTDMTRALPTDVFESRAASIAMGRVGSPDDVARAILFFASGLAGYVTGQVLGVDGGMIV